MPRRHGSAGDSGARSTRPVCLGGEHTKRPNDARDTIPRHKRAVREADTTSEERGPVQEAAAAKRPVIDKVRKRSNFAKCSCARIRDGSRPARTPRARQAWLQQITRLPARSRRPSGCDPACALSPPPKQQSISHGRRATRARRRPRRARRRARHVPRQPRLGTDAASLAARTDKIAWGRRQRSRTHEGVDS